MKNISSWGLIFILFISLGCASKNYVKSQVTPIIDKVNDLDQRAAKNSNDTTATNAALQKDIDALSMKVSDADQKATAASAKADAANQLANKASAQTNSLSGVINNLDNYHNMNEISVAFGSDKDGLDPKATETLDDFATKLPGAGNYIVTVEGDTDAAGSKDYNYELSERRAAKVSSYLASKYNVPAYRIYAIGFGPDKPVADNTSSEGRAQNRRVTIVLMSTGGQTQVGQVPAQSSELK